MSAEATLQAHWRGVTETHSYAALCAFADHLAELWPDAIRQDAEHQLDTGASLPDVLRLNGVPTLKVRYSVENDLDAIEAGRLRFEFQAGVLSRAGVARRTQVLFRYDGLDHPAFDRWEYERVTAFVAWLWEFVKPVEVEPPKAA